MRQVNGQLRDPAPSRLAYRLQRLALTPMVRRAVTFGLPLFAMALIAALALADADRRAALGAWIVETKAELRNRKEFMVGEMSIIGASPTLAEDIHEVLPLAFPVSSFDLDLPRMQADVAALDAVERADLSVRPGGTLEVHVRERMPAVIWRTGTGLILLDEGGHPTASLPSRADRGDLPVISGTGADAATPEALALLDAAGPIGARMRGLVRIGERRWDAVLSGGQRILLPELDPAAALAEVIALHEAQDILDREVLLVDMRLPDRPTLRLTPAAAERMRQTKYSELGGDDP